MIMRWLQRVFHSANAPGEAEPRVGGTEEYAGCRLEAAPRKDRQGWRIAGRIGRERAGEWQTVEFVRADVQGDWEDAVATSLLKARRIVDERGEALFERDD